MRIKEVRRLLATVTVATTLTATALTGCGKEIDLADENAIVDATVSDEVETGGKKIVVNQRDENTEVGTVQNREPAKQTTQDGQAYDDYMQEENAAKLEGKEFTVVPFQTTFYVSSNANVYAKPDNTSEVMGTVKYNTEILTTGKVEEVDWYQFKLDNKEVFISKSFLSEKKLELEETPSTTTTNNGSGSGSGSTGSSGSGNTGSSQSYEEWKAELLTPTTGNGNSTGGISGSEYVEQWGGRGEAVGDGKDIDWNQSSGLEYTVH